MFVKLIEIHELDAKAHRKYLIGKIARVVGELSTSSTNSGYMKGTLKFIRALDNTKKPDTYPHYFQAIKVEEVTHEPRKNLPR